jgi:hypothetical protein
MRDISDFLREEWNKRHGEEWNNDERLVRVERVPGRKYFFRVTHSSSLEAWTNNPTRKRYQGAGCFFCEEHDQYHYLEKVMDYQEICLYHNAKFVAPCHFLACPVEHRQYPTPQDFISLTSLAVDSGLTIFGNLKDSGASYPRHIHYQPISDEVPPGDEDTKEAFKDSVAPPSVLPIKAMDARRIFHSGGLSLFVVDWPLAVYFWEYEGERAQVIAAAAASRTPQPFNPMFAGNRIYVVGRKSSHSPSLDGFKVAAAEAYGCFFCRKRSQWDELSLPAIMKALTETGIMSDSNESSGFEESVVMNTKEVC